MSGGVHADDNCVGYEGVTYGGVYRKLKRLQELS